MKARLALPISLSLTAPLFATSTLAAEVDARPPDRLALSGNRSELTDTKDEGGGGSLNWTHYFTPDVVFGMGAEHQFVEESKWTFGTLRGAVGFGDSGSKLTLYGEVQYGEGDDNGRDFDYGVAVLGFNQSLTPKLFVQLEGRQIDIDTSHGNLPKLSVTYVWTPQVATSVSYANTVSGNLGTELTSARIDYYGRLNLILGGAWGQADPNVVNLQPGLSLPAQDLREGFFGIGKTFARGEIQLLGDYLKLADSEKVSVTLSFTAFVGSRGR
jgi:hypothetical protein